MAPSMAHPQWMPTPAKFRRQFTGRARGASATSTTEVDVVVGHAVGDAGVDAPALQLWRCQQLDDAMDERDDGLIRNVVVLECANLHGRPCNASAGLQGRRRRAPYRLRTCNTFNIVIQLPDDEKRITDVLIRGAAQPMTASVNDVRNLGRRVSAPLANATQRPYLVYEHHHVLLEAFGGVREPSDVAEREERVDATAWQHRVQRVLVPGEILRDDIGARRPKSDLQQ